MFRRFSSSRNNPFNNLVKDLKLSQDYRYFSIPALVDPRVYQLPYSISVLLESAIRNCDEFSVKSSDVENILNWQKTVKAEVEIPFKPARVVLQDLTGVPAVVDLAAMRDAVVKLGKSP